MQGVQGVPGPTAVSADAGNVAVLGTDAKIYVPTPTGGGTGSDEVTIQSSLPALAGLELWVDPNASAGATNASHNALTGLDADDHKQYHTDVRGDARYVKKSGDTMAGPLTVQAPSLPGHAARLQDATGAQSRVITAGNGLVGGGDLTQDRTLHVGPGPGIAVSADLTYVDTVWADARFVTKAMFVVSTAAAQGTLPAGAVWVQY